MTTSKNKSMKDIRCIDLNTGRVLWLPEHLTLNTKFLADNNIQIHDLSVLENAINIEDVQDLEPIQENQLDVFEDMSHLLPTTDIQLTATEDVKAEYSNELKPTKSNKTTKK